MEKKEILTAVKLAPSQRAKVERWASLSGNNISTVLRSLIDAMDARTEMVFFVAHPEVVRAQSEQANNEKVLAL